mmetsp:Transcript_124648/g.216087  ORF Transcript_124648/g.216087 Transcript_124648/m.216087 type:complete len:87 (-) Transcript_124648:38-298(-)
MKRWFGGRHQASGSDESVHSETQKESIHLDPASLYIYTVLYPRRLQIQMVLVLHLLPPTHAWGQGWPVCYSLTSYQTSGTPEIPDN